MKNTIYIDLESRAIHMGDDTPALYLGECSDFVDKSLYMLNCILDDGEYALSDNIKGILYDFDNDRITLSLVDCSGNEVERYHVAENLEARYSSLSDAIMPNPDERIEMLVEIFEDDMDAREKAIDEFCHLREKYMESYYRYIDDVKETGRIMQASGLKKESKNLIKKFALNFDKKDTIELYRSISKDEIREHMNDEESLRMVAEMFVLLEEEYEDLMKIRHIFAGIVNTLSSHTSKKAN